MANADCVLSFCKLELSASPQPSSVPCKAREGRISNYSPKQTGLSLLLCVQEEIKMELSWLILVPSPWIKALPAGSFHLPRTDTKSAVAQQSPGLNQSMALPWNHRFLKPGPHLWKFLLLLFTLDCQADPLHQGPKNKEGSYTSNTSHWWGCSIQDNTSTLWIWGFESCRFAPSFKTIPRKYLVWFTEWLPSDHWGKLHF